MLHVRKAEFGASSPKSFRTWGFGWLKWTLNQLRSALVNLPMEH
jgi:hypothetical protein